MRAVFLLLATGLLVGCSSAEVARLSDEVYSPLPEAAPVELTTGDLDGEYVEIAILDVDPQFEWKYLLPWVDGGGSIERLNETFRTEARALGADAVVRINYETHGDGSSANGTAVRRLGS